MEKMYNEIKEIEMITAKGFDHFIKKIIQKEDEQKKRQKINLKHINWLAKIDSHPLLESSKIPDEIKEQVQLGIVCSFCDYGVLNNEKDLDLLDLPLFFDQQVPIEKIEDCLSKYFTTVM